MFFCFLFSFLHESSKETLQKRVPEEAASYVRYSLFWTHFFDVAKKHASEREGIGDPYTRGSKNHPKKVQKMRNGPRRGVSPGRPGAQNRQFLKGFFPKGSGGGGAKMDAWAKQYAHMIHHGYYMFLLQLLKLIIQSSSWESAYSQRWRHLEEPPIRSKLPILYGWWCWWWWRWW